MGDPPQLTGSLVLASDRATSSEDLAETLGFEKERAARLELAIRYG